MNKDNFKMVEHEQFVNKICLLFSGDKGGSHMKFHVEIINSEIIGSVDNVHIYCMFEASDSIDNMWKVWVPHRDEIKKIQEADF